MKWSERRGRRGRGWEIKLAIYVKTFLLLLLHLPAKYEEKIK
jgi:hypothetical protein